ncbi:hypothetical protein DNTS_031421 [Danionella cerebrum]|nr:hypothetical protein DNTS_031421 [Danionella translucida]
MTSTATIQIHVEDKNDNVPLLKETMISVCHSHDLSSTNITAYDIDGDPYSGPFSFEVMGDHKEEWRFDPSHGNTVHLVKEQKVHSNLYTLTVKISDKQGCFVLQNLTVAACDCAISPNCLLQRNAQRKAGSAVLGITIIASLMMFACLLLAITCACRTVRPAVQVENVLEDALLSSNIEKPGTDCTVPTSLLRRTSFRESTLKEKNSENQWVSSKNMTSYSQPLHMESWSRKSSQGYSNEQTWMWKHSQKHSENHYQGSIYRRSSQRRKQTYFTSQSTLESLLTQRLLLIESQENGLVDYEPHLYNFEDIPDNFSDLDPIDLPNNEFDPEQLCDLGPAFKHLASICNPGMSLKH